VRAPAATAKLCIHTHLQSPDAGLKRCCCAPGCLSARQNVVLREREPRTRDRRGTAPGRLAGGSAVEDAPKGQTATLLSRPAFCRRCIGARACRPALRIFSEGRTGRPLPAAPTKRRCASILGLRQRAFYLVFARPGLEEPRFSNSRFTLSETQPEGHARRHAVHCGEHGLWDVLLAKAAGDGPWCRSTKPAFLRLGAQPQHARPLYGRRCAGARRAKAKVVRFGFAESRAGGRQLRAYPAIFSRAGLPAAGRRCDSCHLFFSIPRCTGPGHDGRGAAGAAAAAQPCPRTDPDPVAGRFALTELLA